jgi:uncharacterized protein (TIGR02996 family)
MSDEAFLRAIQATPTVVAPRLVYADWLEEQGDPRAEFLRLACALDALSVPDRRAMEPGRSLQALAETLEPRWVNQVLGGRAWLFYHRQTFALLGEQPKYSGKNIRMMERWESNHGVTLPLALREWYSFEGAERRLAADIIGYDPLSLQRALKFATFRLRRQQQLGTPSAFLVGRVPGGDGGDTVLLEGGQDPPMEDDGGYLRDIFGAPERFSAFVFRHVWCRLIRSEPYWGMSGRWWEDWECAPERATPDFPLLQVVGVNFGPRDTSFLAERFTEGVHVLAKGRWRRGRHPQTGEGIRFYHPTSELRFFSPGVRLQVVCQGDPSSRAKPAYWEISADSVPQLVEAVAQHLWKYRDLSRAWTSPTTAGQKVLELVGLSPPATSPKQKPD